MYVSIMGTYRTWPSQSNSRSSLLILPELPSVESRSHTNHPVGEYREVQLLGLFNHIGINNSLEPL